jgi:hypothetical protein
LSEKKSENNKKNESKNLSNEEKIDLVVKKAEKFLNHKYNGGLKYKKKSK